MSFIKQTGIIGLILFFICVLVSIPLFTGFNGLYGQDSYSYLNHARQLYQFIDGGVSPPKFYWPVGYPLVGAILGFFSGSVPLSLQAISILCSAITLFYSYKIGLFLYPEKKTEILLFLGLFYCMSPFVVRSSVAIMSDTLAVTCICVAFYSYLQFDKKGLLKDLLFVIFFACIGFLARYVTLVVLFIPLLFCAIRCVKERQFIYFIPAALLALITVSPHLYFKSGLLVESIQHEWLMNWSIGNFFQNSFNTADGFQHYPLVNLFAVFANFVHPGFVFAGCLFLIWKRFYVLRTPGSWSILLCVFAYILFLSGIPAQNQRLLLLSFPFVLIVFLPSVFQVFSHPLFKRHIKLIVALIMVVQTALCIRAMVPFYRLNQMEKSVAESVALFSDYSILYTSGMDGPLTEYGIPQIQKSLYLNAYSSFETPSLVLINPREIESQWQGKNPGVNWLRLKTNYRLRLLRTYSAGWKLYEIN